MSSMLSLFGQNILPILLTAGAGFLLGKTLEIDPKTISRAVFYLFSPCLIFVLLTDNQLDSSDTLQILSFAIVSTLVIGLIALVAGKLLKIERSLLVAVMITVMFTNAGNFGLSLNDFAFGKTALAYASLFYVMSGILLNTLGVFTASSGKAGFLPALIGLTRIPAVYGLLLAVAINLFDWTLPEPLYRTVSILSQAAIPGMLVLLGLQLQRVDLHKHRLALGSAVVIRMLVAPLAALALSALFAMDGPAKQAAVTEASMPTAVMTTVLATEFDVHPDFVTTVITATTLLSPFTLTPLLALLGAH